MTRTTHFAICPAILAANEKQYSEQVHRVASFAKRIQIDLMDGKFALAKSVSLGSVWWPPLIKADIHLMYQTPMKYLDKLIALRPNMVIIHAEADVNHMHFAAELHKEEIKAGLAILPDTSIDSVEELLDSFDHLLIFSGNLGHFGGKTDLSLLGKIAEAKEINPGIEIGWDGGINDKNAAELVQARVDVLNVGGFIQKSDRPKEAYAKLEALAESTKIK